MSSPLRLERVLKFRGGICNHRTLQGEICYYLGPTECKPMGTVVFISGERNSVYLNVLEIAH